VSLFFRIWLIALVAKTAGAILLPFSSDEAYYWVWGHHPQWSYFDHPPMVGWLFWIGQLFENVGNGARLPGVWLGHATLFIWSIILKPILNEKQRAGWVLFMVLSPFFGVGALVITPDVPLLFFWSLAILVLLRLFDAHRSGLYIAFGVVLGLGFCSKYMMVLLVPIALLWLLWSGGWRRLRWRFVPLTIFFGLFFCLPVVYWNSQHEWTSFRFQLDHGLASATWNAIWPAEYLGGQILILFPTVAWLALRPSRDQNLRLLSFAGWLPILFFLYTSFNAHVEANWPIMAHPALLTLAFVNSVDSGKAMKALHITMLVWATAALLVTSEAIHHWLPIEQDKLKTAEFARFDIFLPYANGEHELYLGSYQMAAAVSYKTRGNICKLGGLNRRDFYDFLPQCFPTSDHFWLGREAIQPLPEWLVKKGYRELSIQQLSNEFQLVEVGRSAQGSGR
jgi:4-amino-4-deoxy-L-arabinose transferase-like glycosyltransferase